MEPCQPLLRVVAAPHAFGRDQRSGRKERWQPKRRTGPQTTHTEEQLQSALGAVPRDEVIQILGTTAASVYGFDVDKLSKLAAEIGPKTTSIGA